MDDQTKVTIQRATLVAQALGVHEPVTKAIVPPIHMSATYLRDPDNGYRAGYVYGRTDNVSVQQAEDLIAALEGADEALLFGSGMAAATTVLLALDKPTHIVASQVMYWGFRSWLREIGRYGHQRHLRRDLRSRRGARRGAAGRNRPVLDRDAEQSALDHHRHRRDRRDRACRRRDPVRRLDRGDADLHAAAGARRRHRDAFGHQISQRPFRRHRRRAGDRRRQSAVGADSRQCAASTAACSARSRPGC